MALCCQCDTKPLFFIENVLLCATHGFNVKTLTLLKKVGEKRDCIKCKNPAKYIYFGAFYCDDHCKYSEPRHSLIPMARIRMGRSVPHAMDGVVVLEIDKNTELGAKYIGPIVDLDDTVLANTLDDFEKQCHISDDSFIVDGCMMNGAQWRQFYSAHYFMALQRCKMFVMLKDAFNKGFKFLVVSKAAQGWTGDIQVQFLVSSKKWTVAHIFIATLFYGDTPHKMPWFCKPILDCIRGTKTPKWLIPPEILSTYKQ